jgi:uncharacterized UBP type Zn finger protein
VLRRGSTKAIQDTRDKRNTTAKLAVVWHVQMPDGPQREEKYEKVRNDVPDRGEQVGHEHVDAPSGEGWHRNLRSRNALEDRADYNRDVEQSVDPDEKKVDPVDDAAAGRDKDFEEEEEDGKLRKQDSDAVHDRGYVLELEVVSR